MNINLNNEKIEEIKLQYGFGDCAVFALALSTIYNLPIVEFYAGKEMYHVALVIEGKTIKEDKFLDVFGLSSYSDIKKRYSMLGKQTIEVKTPEELNTMTIITSEDFELAKNNLVYIMEHNVLPLPCDIAIQKEQQKSSFKLK